MDETERIGRTGLVPVVVIHKASDAVNTADALYRGGIDVMEITLRTAAGPEAIAAVAEKRPDVLVGAGTVLSLTQCKESLARGAKFIVSPGFDPEIVAYCIDKGIVVYPGCVTPTEIMAAMKMGLSVLKFFPAGIYGGATAIQALSGPFPDVKFIPTGGVDLTNLKEYRMPQILAVGGGWLCPEKDIASGNYEHITEICRQSVEILS
jgi:2-dehydro-3-deoxyphosphogluconate aldolase/(4S)-4-hydroxy-2-oxoglutarate aldolase